MFYSYDKHLGHFCAFFAVMFLATGTVMSVTLHFYECVQRFVLYGCETWSLTIKKEKID